MPSAQRHWSGVRLQRVDAVEKRLVIFGVL